MIGGAKGIGIGIDFGIPNQYCRATSKPYIEKNVLDSLRVVASAYGKSSNDADRSVVKNLVDPDNPFVISNADYTEGSGYADKDSPYYGAFVTDGIDDLITSTKSATEMLDGSNEITVVSMIHQIKTNSDVTRNNWFFTPVSYLGNRVVENKTGKTGIYGYTSTNVTNAQISDITPILGDKNDYTLYSKIEDGDRDYFTVEGFQNQGIWYVSSIAWYWTIIANKVLTTDQINQVIAYFNLDRTLKPDILCNTIKQGITNENHAEFGDKLIDFSGNGRDIQLNNIAWNKDSGIGKYGMDFLEWKSNSDMNFTSTKLTSTKPNLSGGWLTFRNVSELISETKVKVSGAPREFVFIGNNNGTDDKFSVTINNGVYTIPEFTLSSASGFYINNNSGDWSNLVIEQIPSHAGALCLDGVNDFGKVTGMPIYKDYTFIIDRQIIYIGDTAGVVASKSESAVDTTKQGAFLFEYLGAPDNISTWSFYKDNGKVANTDFIRGISYQSKYSYNGKDLTVGTSKDSDKLWLGTIRDNDSRLFNGAIYSLMSFPYSMSEFLIERQLKKYKLGTLYPDMVEFRPVIKHDDRITAIKYYHIKGSSWINLKPGDYIPVGSKISITTNLKSPYTIANVVSSSLTDIKVVPSAGGGNIYDILGYVTDKSPQKINLTIEQDENYVLFNPVITSNVEYHKLDFYLNNYQKRINIGDYIPKGAYLRANFYLKNNVDELTVFTFNGVNIGYRRSSVDDTAFNIGTIYNYDSPQEVNITVDEYIRYEDIDFTNCYPGVPRIYVNDKSVTWGNKLKVGDKFTFYGCVNILPEMYNVLVKAKYNGEEMTYGSIGTITKSMTFTSFRTYTFDNNEPKCILSPRLLRIPNSSYKILGHIPDISGHGNHGVIHNSAYAEGSGVNEDGSYQFDGVDDFVTIPTLFSGGKQVLMKVNWDKTIADAILYDQRGYPNEFAIYNADVDNNNNPVFAYQARNNGQTYIDGILNKNIKASELRAITHNITITNELSTGTNTSSPVIGSNRVHDAYFTNMALYDFMLFDNVSTDDKIKQLNEYVEIELNVWGTLTQLSNSTLISNETLIKNE